MYSKIIKNNVKRSLKDYLIYFLTLAFAVCIFYSFNSIDSQTAILEISSTQVPYAELLLKIISIISIFVSIILGGIIVYANNFLIKKRKKEFAIYMILGMGKSKVSKIISLETLIVGLISLIFGLIFGIVISQGLSIFTAKLFEATMNEYSFIFSKPAVIKTIAYFSIIFILVMIFNVISISKYKLIDLLNSSKKNESVVIKSNIVSAIIFIVGVALIGAAYYLIKKNGLNINDIRFILSILFGTLGTLLFFFGLGSFILNVIKSSKRIFFKELNIFLVKQISNKINTNFISMTIICLMLFFTISVLSLGLSFKNVLEKGIEDKTPFDSSAVIYIDEDTSVDNMEEAFNKMNYQFNNNQEHIYFNEYSLNVSTNEILNKYIGMVNIRAKIILSDTTNAISITDYNKIRNLKGEGSLELNDNEVLVASNMDMIKEAVKLFVDSGNSIEIDGKEYFLKDKEIITEAFYSSEVVNNPFTLIVPDKVVEGLRPYTSYININYKGNTDEVNAAEKEFSTLWTNYRDGNIKYTDFGFFIIGDTKNQLIEDSKGLSTVVLYIDIYIGIIFLLSSAAVLALQQLSEASNSADRYKSLKRIGATNKMINKTIFIQTAVYFIVPLILAVVHSVIGIDIANDFIKLYGSVDVFKPAIITSIIIIAVYGGYFYVTYSGYKNIVKNNI